jgi:hypothetical protein
VVECDLAKVEVAGSNPVSRSRNYAPFLREGFFFVSLPPTSHLRHHGVTVKTAALVDLPPGVVTAIVPVLAPAGTLNVTLLSEFTV